jgi:hypothetical protein
MYRGKSDNNNEWNDLSTFDKEVDQQNTNIESLINKLETETLNRESNIDKSKSSAPFTRQPIEQYKLNLTKAQKLQGAFVLTTGVAFLAGFLYNNRSNRG